MPHRAADDPRNVLLNEMNRPFADYALDGDAMAWWAELIRVRDGVNAVLESARAEKRIGKGLEAKAALPSGRLPLRHQMTAEELADLLIVSQVEFSSDVTDIQVEPAQGAKCERCWKILPTVGQDGEHPSLCGRCARVVRKLDIAF